MANSSVMQSILVSPVTGIARGLGLSQMTPCSYMPRQQRIVRCMAEDGSKEATTPSPSSPLPTPPPPPKAKGPAPERINGRLAMIGFVAAIAVEIAKGEDVFAQISNGGISWFLLTTTVLFVAYVIPQFSGMSVESKGFMTSDADMWNGRFAMLGLVALAFTEFVKGGALV